MLTGERELGERGQAGCQVLKVNWGGGDEGESTPQRTCQAGRARRIRTSGKLNLGLETDLCCVSRRTEFDP